MMNSSNSLYNPIYTLKQFAENIWIVDGETISFYGLPFTTRMTIVRLKNNDLWLHSPIKITPELKKQIDKLGVVKYLISPNKIHYWYLDEMQKLYPDAVTYANPGVRERAKKFKKSIVFHKDLEMLNYDETWLQEIEMEILQGSRFMQEAVFFHKFTSTLIVTDIIENFESKKIGPVFKFLAKISGALAPNGGTTIDQRLTYFGNHELIRKSVNRIIFEWQPGKIILCHGKCIEDEVTNHLRRIFSWTGLQETITGNKIRQK
jgi:hypothetical protein